MRTPHVRSFFSALNEKMSQINIFAVKNVRRRTLFSELRGLFLRTPCKTWKTAPENSCIL